ncbi:NAD(P)-binding protein [Stemphylium lycopersici]|uniref:NAD(P)-binding protein n=1 Tax=Stemphylium lycopersici TaxID=183478 RepID=A0A364N6A4_STELY|nr:short chain alcohol dehydrogenase [Stemphylium lycopersici]RAR00386.1 NAD(P)-binding protein [Stemphylium lycopersici]RAR12772.1 NAD(P)-binding protein [Stemphylium lycopersici]
MPSTKSKNIIITGGARGIGRCTARHLLSLPASHRVFIIDFDAEELEYVVSSHLAAYAPRVSSSVTNLRNKSEIKDAVAQAAAFFGGRIDVLVNNAGVARGFFNAGNGTMEDEATGEQWEAYIATNLSAPFYMSQAVIPYMKSKNSQKEGAKGVDRKKDLKRTDEFDQLPVNLHGEDRLDEGGCIINVASFRAHQSDPDCEGYAASKGGVLALTQAMSISCQRWGIRVMAISPGWVSVQHECKERDLQIKDAQNGAYKEVAPHEEHAEKLRMMAWADDLDELYHKQHPAGRVGRGEDLAEMVEYVMGAGFLSGQELILDGGANRRKNPNI